MKTVDGDRAEVLSSVARKILEVMNAEKLSANEALIVLARIMGQCEGHGLLHGELHGSLDAVHAEISGRVAEERDAYIAYAREKTEMTFG